MRVRMRQRKQGKKETVNRNKYIFQVVSKKKKSFFLSLNNN